MKKKFDLWVYSTPNPKKTNHGTKNCILYYCG